MTLLNVEITVKDMEIFKKLTDLTKELIDKLPENEQNIYIKRIDKIINDNTKL